MIPILYEKDETLFESNGLGRLRDCISCTCVEERNSIYEVDFEYPVNGAHYDEIKVGRIIGVTHDESGDIQPFDIVSYTKPIDGIVTFHCVHISYRQSYMTAIGTNINNLANAFYVLSTAEPNNPFNYQTDKHDAGYMGAGNGLPHSVRSMLGGMEGSILDAYGGEYEWDKWTVKLWEARGEVRNFSIRYGVNMLDFNEEYDIQGTYSSCIPFWTDGMVTQVGGIVRSVGQTITGRDECVPLDLSDRFEEMPTQGELEARALSYMNGNNTFIPSQNIHVEFARLQDLGYEEYGNLLECNLCDTINVIFPDYNGSAQYKIVKTVWDVLRDRYESMELGDLSVTLAEALGVSSEKEAKNNILNSIYPIGSVYISTNAVSPADLFGGTWAQIKGRFLLGTGAPDDNTNTYWGTNLTYDGTNKFNETAGTTGGESMHTLIEYEMPAHSHANTNVYVNAAGDGTSIMTAAGGSYGTAFDYVYNTSSVGGGGTHNNMPPFLSVYMWERTA